MGITQETRREAYEAIGAKRPVRRALLLEVLGDREMTVDELVEELIERGELRGFDRNFVAPRMTELKDDGLVETIGKRESARSGIRVAVWRQKKSRPGAGTTETAEKETIITRLV